MGARAAWGSGIIYGFQRSAFSVQLSALSFQHSAFSIYTDPWAAVRGGWPLRVAGYFCQKPFRQVSGTFLRAGASPCTRNGRWWIAKVGLPCLGCDQLLLARICQTPQRGASTPLFVCSFVRLFRSSRFLEKISRRPSGAPLLPCSFVRLFVCSVVLGSPDG
jgi:hypothetical protein